MINIENETRGAVLRCFGPLGFVFLVLALSFGSLASNAAPQVLKGNAGMTPCRVTSINAATGVVTAKVNSSGQSFRFLVKDAALRSSLKEGQEIFADFNTQQVFTSAGVRLGSILTDNTGKSSTGPAGGANPPQKIEGAQPAGPGGSTSPQPNKILQPNKAARPAGPGTGTNLQPDKILQPNKVAQPAGLGGGTKPAGPIGGANVSNTANTEEHYCTITNINTARGVVAAKVNSSGQFFRFFVKDPALLNSLKEGQEIFADSNTQEVFTIKSGTGKGKGTARLGSILTDNYTKMSGGPAGGTNPAGPGTVAGQPKTESAPVAPGGSKAAMNNVASTGNTAAVPQIQNFAVFAGPIPGGQKEVGRVDLSAVPPNGATIQISSDHPEVASVPKPIQVPNSSNFAVVEVNTSPVTQPTDVTLSAQVVGSSQVSTTKLTVRPPAPAVLQCSPSTLIGGTPIHCKVWLDGPAPGSAVRGAKAGASTSASSSISASRTSAAASNAGAQIQISTNNSQVASVPGGAISVPAGATSAEFQVPTTAYPEPVDVVISASNQGTTQKASVILTAAAIRSFGCGSDGNSSCEILPGQNNYGSLIIMMTFSGPTPAGFITVSSNSGGAAICNSQSYCNPSLAVPQQAGAKSEALRVFITDAVTVPTTVTLSATDPLSNLVKTVQLKIDPPTPARVLFLSQSGVLTSINNVFAGGQQVVTVVQLNGDEPIGGITFDVKYSASDAAGNPLQGAVTGPAQFTYGPLPQFASACTAVALTACFYTTVQPCEVNAPCKVSVTVGTATGTLSVNP